MSQTREAGRSAARDGVVRDNTFASTEHAKGHALTPKEVGGFHNTLDKKIHAEAKYDKLRYLHYGQSGGPGYPKREDAEHGRQSGLGRFDQGQASHAV